MNKISPKTLLNSKWTSQNVIKRQKHFIVTEIEFDDDKNIIRCEIEAVMSKQTFQIHWRELKDSSRWKWVATM